MPPPRDDDDDDDDDGEDDGDGEEDDDGVPLRAQGVPQTKEICITIPLRFPSKFLSCVG